MRFIFALILMIGFPFFVKAEATQHRKNDVILLEEGQVFRGDYFASGSSVEISGTVEGDAYVAAGQAIIDGVIKGDLLILCGGAEISGEVQGNIRILGGQVTVSGNVQQNATLVAGNVQLSPSSVINGNVVIAAGNADSHGSIKGNAKILASNVRFSSHVNGNVTAYVGEIRVTSKGFIGGALDYRSNEPAWIDDRAQIKGPIEYHPSLLHSLMDWPWLKGLIIGSKIVALAMNFLFTMAFGWILIRMFPSKLSRTIDVLNTKTLNCLRSGIIVLIVVPLLALLLLITVLGAPFAVALVALNILGFYTAKIFFILWIATTLFSRWHIKRSKMFTLAVGLAAYYIITMIPYIGMGVTIVAMLLGMGAIVLAQTEKHVFLPEPHEAKDAK